VEDAVATKWTGEVTLVALGDWTVTPANDVAASSSITTHRYAMFFDNFVISFRFR
jgi:hypothetical protein